MKAGDELFQCVKRQGYRELARVIAVFAIRFTRHPGRWVSPGRGMRSGVILTTRAPWSLMMVSHDGQS